jgi:hypothetical protein
MPKDNQEEYQSWHEDLQVLMEEYWEVWESTTDVRLCREQFDKLKAFMTTYGNARELAGVEKCIKLSDEIELREPDGGTRQWMAFKAFRNTMRDRVATIKSELTTHPGQTDMDRPLNFERE